MSGPRREISETPKRITFGRLAVRKGYVSTQQVEEALRVQQSLNERDGKNMLIGLIMLEMGVLGTTELIDVLKDMDGKWDGAAKALTAPLAMARSRTSRV